jgi:predicted phosphate transport protein (TIGR00153 family)
MAITRDKLFWDGFANHGERAVACSALLLDLTRAPERSEELTKKVHDLEREADEITHQVMNALHQTWITPIDREEIHALIKSLDDVVDAIDGIAERFRVYGIKSSRTEAPELAENISASCKAMNEALKLLRDMKNANRVLALVKAIGAEEHRADKALAYALKRLFEEEKDAVEILKWRDLYERLERATDRTMDVANIMEAIVLEHA